VMDESGLSPKAVGIGPGNTKAFPFLRRPLKNR
jgi:hypothetical protein